MDPSAVSFDEGRLFPICCLGSLHELFSSCAIDKIVMEEIDIETYFRDFEEYWEPFLGGQGPAGVYLKQIPDKNKNDIKNKIKQLIPISKDGSITLIALALIIWGFLTPG